MLDQRQFYCRSFPALMIDAEEDVSVRRVSSRQSQCSALETGTSRCPGSWVPPGRSSPTGVVPAPWILPPPPPPGAPPREGGGAGKAAALLPRGCLQEEVGGRIWSSCATPVGPIHRTALSTHLYSAHITVKFLRIPF